MTEMAKLELVPVTAPSAVAPLSEHVPSKPKRARATPTVTAPAQPEPKASRQSPAPNQPEPASWRQWSSFDRTSSFRLPPELLDELEERVWRLRLSTGVTVAAALTLLLDQPDQRLVELVERAEQAKPRRRTAPRR